MDTDTVWKAIAEYGFLTVFAGAVLVVLYKYAIIRLKRYEHRAIRIRLTVPKDHYFFSRIDYVIAYQIPRTKLKHHKEYHVGRTMLFRFLLNIKLTAWKKTMYKICDTNYDKMTKEAMGDDILKKLTHLISTYEEQWLNSGIPLVVVEGFNNWHGMRAEVFISGVGRICTGRSYDTVTEIKSAILDLSVSLLCHTILDTEQTLGDLNGELTGLTYRGYKL